MSGSFNTKVNLFSLNRGIRSMQVVLKIKRFPFISYPIYDSYSRSFKFIPKIFDNTLTDEQEFKFGEFLASISDELRNIRDMYNLLTQKLNNVKFIEFKEIEIPINERQLQKIIEYAKANGLPLRPYAEILPSIDEQQFERIMEYAKRHGYKNAISKFLSH